MFYHQHIVNGEVVVHSHFHLETHDTSGDGGHSVEVIRLIAVLNNFSFCEDELSYHPLFADRTLEATIQSGDIAPKSYFAQEIISLRAPPRL